MVYLQKLLKTVLKVSILLTCYNFERYITTAVNSLLNQDFKDKYEIILTDDGSSDQSVKMILNLPQSDKLKVIINERNLGVASSLNNAFEKATGEYLCRFDGDDVWEPNFLTNMCKMLDELPEIALAYSNCSYINDDGVITNFDVKTRRKVKTTITDEFKDLVEDYYITAPTVMFRKAILHKIFPLPSNLKFLDWLISLSVAQQHKIGYLNQCLSKYRIHANGMHVTMVRDLYGEQTTNQILDQFLTEERFEKSEIKKIRIHHAKTFILRYFGCEMYEDTKRLVHQQLKLNGWSIFFDKQILKYYVASFMGKQYNLLKKWSH